MDIDLNKKKQLIFLGSFILLIPLSMNSGNFLIKLFGKIISFFFFTFVPGYILLEILNLKKEGILKLLYSLAFSLLLMSLAGFLLNLLAFIGFRPFKEFLILVYLLFISLMLILLYSINTTENAFYMSVNTKDFKYVFLLFLPILVTLGCYFMNRYNSNFLIIISLISVALFPLLIYKIPSKYYPLLLWIASLSLTLHVSLISNDVWGSDVQGEYFLASVVSDEGKWNPFEKYNVEILDRYNSLLSVGILPTFYSLLLDVDLKWIYKLIYPLILSFISLGLYAFYKRNFNNKISFLASYYVISFSTFFLVSLEAPRQIIAMIFLVLILETIINNEMKSSNEKISLLLLMVGLIVSHYGISYMLLFILLMYIASKGILRYIYKFFTFNEKVELESDLISYGFLTFSLCLALGWYIYVSNAVTFDIIVKVGSQVINSFGELGDPFGTSVASTLSNKPVYVDLSNILRILSFILIPFGLYRSLNKNLNIKYLNLAMLFLLLFFLTVLLPYLAPAMGLLRINIVLMFILAPFSVNGVKFLYEKILKFRKFNWGSELSPLMLYSVFLFVIVILNTGIPHLFYQDQDKYGGSFSINNKFDYSLFSESDVKCSKWLTIHSTQDKIYADNYRRLIFLRFGKLVRPLRKDENIGSGSYIFLNSWNLRENIYSLQIPVKSVWLLDYRDISEFNKLDRIYDGGNSTILYKK